MAALSAAADRLSRNRGGVRIGSYTVSTAGTIYQGGLVAMNLSTGRAVAATAATSRKLLGVAKESKSSGAAITVEWNAEFKITPAAALTKAYTGSNVAVSTDNDVTTASGAGTAAVRVLVGEMVQYVSSTECWVSVRNFSEAQV